MNTFLFRRIGALALVVSALTGAAVAAPASKTPAKKPPVKAKPKPAPQLGIKKTPQMSGAVGRFGELYALKSGWTYQILGAHYSYDAFDDYNGLYPGVDEKLLVLDVAIKNNTTSDNWFSTDQHSFQVQDSKNQLYTSNTYRLASLGSNECSLTLKPGQGAGQDPKNLLQVAIPIKDDSQITKIVLNRGRQGSNEDVMRFFVAGTEGGDAKNIIKPAPVAWSSAPIKATGFFPSHTFAFRVNGVTFTSEPIAGTAPEANRRFAVVNLTVKNTTSKALSTYEFLGGNEAPCFTDADGEKYPLDGSFGLLKASSDEKTETEFAPGVERNLRIVFPVPVTGELKTLQMSSTRGKLWTFDASAWK